MISRSALTPHRLRQLWYVPVLGTAMAMMLMRVLVMARLLDVSGFAQFSAGLLVSSSFSMLACLGLHSLLQRELPVLLVRGRERRGAVLLAQCILVAMMLAAIAGLPALAGWSVAGLPPAMFAIATLHGLSQQLFLIVTVESRSRGQPLRFARQMIVRSTALVAAGLTAAYLLESVAAALVAEALASLVLAQASLRAAFRQASMAAAAAYRVGLRRLSRVPWTSAAALLSVSLAGFVLLYADRWISAEWLDVQGFAMYAFAWTVLMIAQSVQLIVNASVYPLIARRFASHGAGTAFGISLRISLTTLVVGAVLAAPIWALADVGVRRWLSVYAPASELIALFVAIAVLRISDFWTSFLIIVGREALLLVLNIGVAVVGLAAWAAWLRPWQAAALTPWDVALLAAVLSMGSYLATAAAAWRFRRR